MIRIAAVCASPKKQGVTDHYLDRFVKSVKKYGATVKKINLYNKPLPLFSGKLSHARASNVAQSLPRLFPLIKEIARADGLVIATPTHWFGPSSIMKVFIDRLTSLEHYGFLLEGKAAGFITYGPQGGALNNAMQLMTIANQWGMISPPYATVFDEGRKDAWVSRDCALLGKNITQLINVPSKTKFNWGY